MAMLRCQTEFVDDCFNGRMTVDDHPEAVPEWTAAPELGFNGQLAPEQDAIAVEIRTKVAH
eukprot:2414839-Karenia_brevis.AAC.1